MAGILLLHLLIKTVVMFSGTRFSFSAIFLFLFSTLFSQNADKWLLKNNSHIAVKFNQYDNSLFNKLIHQEVVDPGNMSEVDFLGSKWKVDVTSSEVKDDEGVFDISVVFRCIGGTVKDASLSAAVVFDNWSVKNYVLMPGAAYNGNRYTYRRINYSPKLYDYRDIGPDKDIILSDVPKLRKGHGPSFIQQRSGDMTTPSIGFYSPGNKKGFFLLTKQGNGLGDYGINIVENSNRSVAEISVTSPVVRELYKYRICDMRYPSDDKPADFSAGDSVVIKFRLYGFDAENVQDLFDKFAEIRKDLDIDRTPATVLPFSAAFPVQEEKFNKMNFVEDWGYYSVGLRENVFQDWQIGWTGGMISTYPLLMAGADSTKHNVIRAFDWLFPEGIAPSGFFWGTGKDGHIWYGDDPRHEYTKWIHLVRKSGDGLYYIIKQFMLMKKLGIEVKKEWEDGARTVADAFVKLWDENHQLGQYVDIKTGKLVIGKTTSGAIVPAALSLASQYFNDANYLKTAEEIGDHYYKNYVQKGLVYGGIGDALQNFDSESSYAMIESFTVLFETTGDAKWVKCGGDMAKQFSTWVISYNYKFPPESLFGKKGMHSIGAVNANTQNKHGSPGICTHSGVGLLKLYRATGDRFYIDLLCDISHSIPQYLVHPLRPMNDIPYGFINERVNTTDWLEGIGEVFFGSTWAETSLMLTYIEIPGLYVQPDKGLFWAFDNVIAEKVKETKKSLTLKISNPTKADAAVKVLVENDDDLKKPLGHNYFPDLKTIKIKAGGEKVLTFKK
jgi:hypothetical protein